MITYLTHLDFNNDNKFLGLQTAICRLYQFGHLDPTLNQEIASVDMEAHKFFTEGEGIEQRLKTQLKELRDDFAERLARKRFKCDQKFSQLEAKINSQKMEINDLKLIIDDLKLDKVRMEKTIDDLKLDKVRMEKTIDDLEKTIDDLKLDKVRMEKTIDDLKKTVDFLIQDKTAMNLRMTEMVQDKTAMNLRMTEMVQDKTAMNLRMTEMEAKMHELFNFHENEKRKCAKGLE